jgi:hypothetical protein
MLGTFPFKSNHIFNPYQSNTTKTYCSRRKVGKEVGNFLKTELAGETLKFRKILPEKSNW